MAGLARALPRPRLPSLPAWKVLRRRLVLVAAIVAALLAGYMLWLRDSSLVAVENVTINGAGDAPEAESALRTAALGQSTLNPDLEALEAAVASQPVVRSVGATTDFPHGLTIDVELREPVGYLKSEGAIVADDGVVLDRTGTRPDGVPAIQLGDGSGGISGGAATGDALRTTRVLGAAPAPLLELVDSAAIDPDLGIVVELGPVELRFGDANSAAQKWLAAAAVLADPGFEGAAYLDLNVPARPVAGGLADAPEGEELEQAVAAAEAAAAPAAPADATPAPAPAAVAPEPEPAPVAPEPASPAPPAEAGTGVTAGGGVTLE